jgi:hypothetical protein
VNLEPPTLNARAVRLPVATVLHLDRVLGGDPVTEDLVVDYIRERWGATSLFYVPRDKAALILKGPADFIRRLKRRSQPELSF